MVLDGLEFEDVLTMVFWLRHDSRNVNTVSTLATAPDLKVQHEQPEQDTGMNWQLYLAGVGVTIVRLRPQLNPQW